MVKVKDWGTKSVLLREEVRKPWMEPSRLMAMPSALGQM
jgi:hypothetical protein